MGHPVRQVHTVQISSSDPGQRAAAFQIERVCPWTGHSRYDPDLLSTIPDVYTGNQIRLVRCKYAYDALVFRGVGRIKLCVRITIPHRQCPCCCWPGSLRRQGIDFGINHDDVIKWKHFPRYWPFVRGIHRSRWIPHTKTSDAELWCFLWSASK